MSLEDLTYLRRNASGEPAGALVLLHGRGADERDLYPLFDMLDPDGALVGITPRAPLSLPPGGAHWYVVKQVGFPDEASFRPTYVRAQRWLDALYEEFPPEKVVLGGFSQGAVMSLALGLGAGRPRPAGIVALSGFMATVDGFEHDLTGLDGYPVAIGHGVYDPVITVSFSRQARQRLEEAGADVLYKESPMDHTIDPNFIPDLRTWLTTRLA